ncbi:hypothetical protein MPL1032_130309 [Mesorhizobium plurifarium]|uniref:Uncharacterized protein n=1 Tax=Mesorhizobium plurifarium TaxID=69974 RepID=A0A0K2VQW8_MESPL|nr:hypothetical protein MPL1032_130309 [Mesorhizobium plurifarium]
MPSKWRASWRLRRTDGADARYRVPIASRATSAGGWHIHSMYPMIMMDSKFCLPKGKIRHYRIQ